MIIKYIKTIVRMLPAILSGAMISPCFSSCVDELRYSIDNNDYDGEEISVPVSFSVLPMESVNPESRAVEYIEATEDEKTIHDFWLIEYHENGTRIGLPRFYTTADNGVLPEEIKIIVPRRDTDKYTCVLIANSNDSKLFNADNRSKFSTLDSLRTFELTTHNHEHVFNPQNNKFLLMSGWTTITTDTKTHNLEFNLLRNVCKVNVKLTAFPTDRLVYKYFQWRDVPLGKAFPHGYIKYNQSVSRDWKQHLDDDPDNPLKYKDLREGINFYIPCNVWLPEGPKMPGNNLTENDLTEDPTHFVVVAREHLGYDDEGERIESGEQYEFCLYPSKSKEVQFGFQPNHCYNMEMAIHGLPDYEENDFVNLIDYKYLPESNCYMMKRDSKELFAVPLTRINKYWSKFGESDGVNGPDELLDENTEWVAEVIWQDSPLPILEFTSFRRFQAAKDKSYLEGKGELYTKLNGELVENENENGDWLVPYLWDLEGNELEYLPVCFAFRTTGSGEGNVVIGVRKKIPGWKHIPIEKREYLWSWHIWITDYDPIAATPGYDWIYQDVPGGQVQRFPGAGEVYDDWECVMDRNLGATKTISTRADAEDLLNDVANGRWENRFDDAIKSFGLYYQYGRKDPFPYFNQPVYDIKGKPIEAFSKTPNMIISKPHEAAPPKAAAVRKGAAGKKATRSFDDETLGYDPHPVRLSIKYPYKFYTCAANVEMGILEEKVPDVHLQYSDTYRDILLKTTWTGDTIGTRNWLSPGIETYSGKNLFDPCPVGWIMPDVNSFFGEVSTDTRVDYLEAIYSTTPEGMAEYYTGTLLLYNLADKYKFAYFPATGCRSGVDGKGLEGNIWKVGTKPAPRDPTKVVTVGLTNYLWTIGRGSVSMDAPANTFCVGKEPSIGVPIRCMREFPMDF